MVRESIQECLKTDQKGLMWVLQNKMNLEDLHTNGGLFLYHFLVSYIDIRFAGSDTTGNALSFVLWNLVTCRHAWQKLCSEIRSLSRDELNMKTLQSLPYLTAVIQEGNSSLSILLTKACASTLLRV